MFSNLIIHRTLVGEFSCEYPAGEDIKRYNTHFSMVMGADLDAAIHNTALSLYDAAKPGMGIKEKAEDPLLDEIRQQLREAIDQV